MIRVARWVVWLLDEALDELPWFYMDGGRLRVCHGGYGCLLGLHRFWWPDKGMDPW